MHAMYFFFKVENQHQNSPITFTHLFIGLGHLSIIIFQRMGHRNT